LGDYLLIVLAIKLLFKTQYGKISVFLRINVNKDYVPGTAFRKTRIGIGCFSLMTQ